MPFSQFRIQESPRDVRPDGFPVDAPRQDQLKYVLQYAALAPSTHNSQPWLFRVTDASFFLIADRSRGLPAIDPEDRCLTMSCGAALRNLTLALEALGFSFRVSRFPDLSEPDLLARIDIESRKRTDVDTSVLECILARQTSAPQHLVLPPSAGALSRIQSEVADRGATLVMLRREDLDLVLQFDENNRDDALVLAREEAMWRHPNRIRSRDGIPGGVKQTATSFCGNSGGAVFGVLTTSGDRMLSWLQGGVALESGLVVATRENVGVSLCSMPLHRAHVRKDVGEALGLGGTPQVLVRLAQARDYPAPPTPRRPIVDVMVHPGFTG